MLQMFICIVIITFAIAITIAFGHIDFVTSAPLDTCHEAEWATVAK